MKDIIGNKQEIKKVITSISISSELKKKLEDIMLDRNVSLSKLIEEMIEYYIENEKENL